GTVDHGLAVRGALIIGESGDLAITRLGEGQRLTGGVPSAGIAQAGDDQLGGGGAVGDVGPVDAETAGGAVPEDDGCGHGEQVVLGTNFVQVPQFGQGAT